MATRDLTHEGIRTRPAAPYQRGGGRRKRWLLPLLLGLLPLLLALLIAWIADGGDDQSARRAAPAPQPSLTSANHELLPQTPPLFELVGHRATGRNMTVHSVNGNEGFWVRAGADRRLYVEWGGDVGQDEASSFQPRPGQRVNFEGPVQAAPRNPGRRLKLGRENAAIVRARGAFVNADRVQRAR